MEQVEMDEIQMQVKIVDKAIDEAAKETAAFVRLVDRKKFDDREYIEAVENAAADVIYKAATLDMEEVEVLHEDAIQASYQIEKKSSRCIGCNKDFAYLKKRSITTISKAGEIYGKICDNCDKSIGKFVREKLGGGQDA